MSLLRTALPALICWPLLAQAEPPAPAAPPSQAPPAPASEAPATAPAPVAIPVSAPPSAAPPSAAPPSAAAEDADDEAEDADAEDAEAADAEAAEDDAGDPDDEVRIIGSLEQLSRLGGSAHVVGKKALETFEYDDVHRVLQKVPGAYVRDEDGQGLRPNIGLRGTTSERSAKITLMEDGILLAPAPYAAPAAYYFPLTTRMVGVEVFKGPSAIAHGPNTVGGAINLVTRRIPRGGKAEVDVSTGRFGNDKVHAWGGWGGDRFGVLLEWAQLDSDGFKTLDTGGPTGFAKREAMLKLRWQTDPLADQFHRLQLKLGWSDERSDETYLGLTRADFDADPYRRYAASDQGQMAWWRLQGQLSWRFEVGDTFSLNAVAYRNDFYRDWHKLNSIQGRPSLQELIRDPSGTNAVDVAVLAGEEDSDPRNPLLIGSNGRRFFAQGVDLSSRWTLATGPVTQTLRGGIRVHQDQVRRDHDEAPWSMTQGTLLRLGEDAFRLRNTETALAIAGHLLDEIEIGESLILSPGGRVEVIRTRFEDRLEGTTRESDQTVVLGGFGAVYKFTPAFSVLGGVHQGFTPVSPRSGDFAEPESSLNFEAGTRYLADSTHAEVIGFFNDYDNLLVSCTASAGCLPDDIGRQFNGGAIDVYGVEATIAQAFNLGGGVQLQADLTYTLTLSSFENAFSDPILGQVEAGDALPNVPVHQGALGVGIRTQRLGFDAALQYVGEMRDVAGTGAIPTAERIPDRMVLDLAGHWQIVDAFKLYSRIDNATNNTYIASLRPFGARPGRPLTFTVGLKYQVQ